MRRTLVVLLSTLATLVLPGAPAQAGGPTSVLITNPDSGEAAALYYTSDEYVALERLVQTSKPVDPPPSQALTGTEYTVTWLLHDVMVWRTDFVHIGAVGGPYVQTEMLTDSGSMSQDSTWTRVTNGKALALLLEHALDARSTSSLSLLGESPRPAAVPQAPAAQPEPPWFSLSGWRWAVVGLFGGLLAGVVVSRRRRSETEGRRVLEDRAPERVG